MHSHTIDINQEFQTNNNNREIKSAFSLVLSIIIILSVLILISFLVFFFNRV
jgi:hypothetical protein